MSTRAQSHVPLDGVGSSDLLERQDRDEHAVGVGGPRILGELVEHVAGGGDQEAEAERDLPEVVLGRLGILAGQDGRRLIPERDQSIGVASVTETTSSLSASGGSPSYIRALADSMSSGRKVGEMSDFAHFPIGMSSRQLKSIVRGQPQKMQVGSSSSSRSSGATVGAGSR